MSVRARGEGNLDDQLELINGAALVRLWNALHLRRIGKIVAALVLFHIDHDHTTSSPT